MDTSDPKTFRKQVQKAKLSAKEKTETIRDVMSSKGGRAWIFEMLVRSHIYQTSVNENPHLTYFNEGERNQGLILLSEVESAAPELYTRMIQESQDERRDDSADGNASDDDGPGGDGNSG